MKLTILRQSGDLNGPSFTIQKAYGLQRLIWSGFFLPMSLHLPSPASPGMGISVTPPPCSSWSLHYSFCLRQLQILPEPSSCSACLHGVLAWVMPPSLISSLPFQVTVHSEWLQTPKTEQRTQRSSAKSNPEVTGITNDSGGVEGGWFHCRWVSLRCTGDHARPW